MAKRGSNYTDLGRKIKALAQNQTELSSILGLTQQSISGKLCGKIAVSIDDLEKLAAYYKVPFIYFFLDEGADVERADLIIKMMNTFTDPLISALYRLSQRPEYMQAYVADMAVRGMNIYQQGVRDGSAATDDPGP